MTTLHEFKVVVAGPFASGKTTLINVISDIPVVGTEVPTTGDEALVKATTTVGMEYSTYATGDDEVEIVLHLYGVPGQRRFDFMWDIVGDGLDGLIVIVDAGDPSTWSEAVDVGRHFVLRHDPPTVVAVNRASSAPDALARVRGAVPIRGACYVPCEVTDEQSAREVLIELLLLLLERMPEDEIAV